jgi:3,4-dihydroxy 2-butanone 4-phosphate synthase/GTP cyclohydrolase II
MWNVIFMLNNIINTAIATLQAGKPILLVDDLHRENEADLVFAAQTIDINAMRFMLQHTCGIVCLTLTEEHAAKLGLTLLLPPEANSNQHQTPFAMSFEARHGVSTGISAQDRVTTIRAAMQEPISPMGIVTPGHMFPLIAKTNGVLERRGHTEGSIDLMKLAGLVPAAVICELVNPDKSVAKGEQITLFAQQHDIPIVSIQDIVNHRLTYENFITAQAMSTLPLEQYGEFRITVVKDNLQHREHVILQKDIASEQPPLVRIHSSCLTGDIFHSQRCDCYQQLQYSLELISQQGGVLLYLDQEGRGIGLLNKIKAYALQDQKLDTVEANQRLGFSADLRDYTIAANILRNLGIWQFRLLTNNPGKMNIFDQDLRFNVSREAMPIFANTFNENYLRTKQQKLQHYINFEESL